MIVTDSREIWEQANAGHNVNVDSQINVGLQENAGDNEEGRRQENANATSKEWIHSYDFERLLALMNQ